MSRGYITLSSHWPEYLIEAAGLGVFMMIAGICVMLVNAPGATRTPINTDAWSTPEAYEALMRLVPYKRIGEPEDIARAAVWLASDDSDYVNGVTLFVDGGMTLYPEFASGG